LIKIGNYKLRRIIPYIIINITFIYCIQVKAYVDKNKCSVDDIINYKIELQDASSFGDISIDRLSSQFSIISGPSQQTSMQWINGSVTNSKTISWTLAPKKTGKIKIPSLDVRIGGQTYKTNQITLQVVGSNKKQSDRDVFITSEIDKEEVYLGEQITLTFKLYKKVEISVEPFEIPEFSGFWTEELYRPNQIKIDKKIDLNGVRYEVGTLYKVALFPISGGEYVIEPLTMKVQTQKKRSRRNRDPFFDPFFNSFFTETETKILRSPERKIKIKIFPEPRPSGFSGAVGKFKIETSIDRDSTMVNEAITFKISISGTGNLGLFTIPKFKFSDKLDQFPPKETFEKNNFRDALSGVMSWEYILVPRISGKISIPPIAMTYFDPSIQEWKRISSNSTIIPVSKNNNLVFDNSGLSKKEIELLKKDISYIQISKPVWKKIDENSLTEIIILYALSFLLIPIPMALNLFFGYRLNSEPFRISRSALANAKKKIRVDRGIGSIPDSKIIYTYLKDKIQLPSDNLDPIAVKKILKNRIGQALIEEVVAHLKICDSSHYGGQEENDQAVIHKKTIEILENLDKQIK